MIKTLVNCFVIGCGGAIGSILRYLISLIPFANIFSNKNTFPITTFICNILGAFLLGCFVTILTKNKSMDSLLSLFLRVGLCGGFTTFSTFALESFKLLNTGNILTAFIYIILSVTFSILAIFFAEWIF